jgi:hypothetical protein
MASMAISAPASSRRLTGGVVAMLAACVFINYVDRGNFATAAPLMKDALKLSNTQIGILVSGFFWAHARLASWSPPGSPSVSTSTASSSGR